MYVLVVRDPDGNETEYDLEGEVVLGRDESADIQLPDPGVSRKHLRIFLEDGLCYLEDLGSSNGTLVGGQPAVGAVVLQPGLEAEAGPFSLFVEDTEAGVDESGEPSTSVAASTIPDDGATFAGPVPEGPRGPTLEGKSGAVYGQVIDLVGRVTVGRVPGNTVVIEDPSVSRNHAEIVFEGPDVIVRDLGSSNGTYLNGEPVSEEVLYDGDTVRFGDVDFAFSAGEGGVDAPQPAEKEDEHEGPGALTPSVMPSRGARRGGRSGRGGRSVRGGGREGGLDKKKKLLLAAVGGLGLLVVLGFMLKGSPPPPSTPPPDRAGGGAPSAEIALHEEVFKLMRRATAMMNSAEWGNAANIYRQVVDLDPINKDARAGLRRAKSEVKGQGDYDDAARKQELGELEIAIELYMKIDKESYYYSRAKFRVQEVIDILKRKYHGECPGFYNANRYSDARRVCGRYMDFFCHCAGGGDPKIAKTLRNAERVSRTAAEDKWRCPGEMLRWVRCEHGLQIDGSQASDPGPLIRQKYPDKGIQKAVLIYTGGDAARAIVMLYKIQKNFRSEQQALASELHSNMKVVLGKYKEGEALRLRDDPSGAQRVWAIMNSSDAKIMPSGTLSFYKRESEKQLVAAYSSRGYELFLRDRYCESFEMYGKGVAVAPKNQVVKSGLARLEKRAATLYRQAAKCRDLDTVRCMTVSDPASVSYKQAVQSGRERGCAGY